MTTNAGRPDDRAPGDAVASGVDGSVEDAAATSGIDPDLAVEAEEDEHER